jgi:two-component system CheB/CheR fusion protein
VQAVISATTGEMGSYPVSRAQRLGWTGFSIPTNISTNPAFLRTPPVGILSKKEIPMSRESDPQPSQPTQQGKFPSNLSFPVVGIGASAGGLDAVRRFFEHMPSESGMAFVVIFHLSPDHESNAGKIIEQTTKMRVIQVDSAVAIEQDHVYVISPAQYLSMNDGYLRVSPQGPRHGAHVTIDLFFRDLADVHREKAFCLVLSGAGADGAVGLSRIKEQGGVTLVQSPTDAEYDGMPQSAIRTEMVDFVLPVVDMPQKLLELWKNARHIQLPASNDLEAYAAATSDMRSVALAEHAVHDILVKLRAGTGHDFKHYKRATVLRRIERRLQVTAQSNLSEYYEYLSAHPSEVKALLDDMLIGVTNFFRDREAFDALERDVAPQLFSRYASHGGKHDLRIWSAGASTGEEAYSLVMLFADHKASVGSDVGIQVFASDIDDRAVSAGRAGLYSQAIVADVPPTRLRQYFAKEDDRYRVRKEVRDSVLFAKHSLLTDPPFSQMDLIVCRNLLIYLDRDVQREILQMFHFALNPGGFLFLGSSESADLCQDLFSVVDKKNRIFRARSGAVPSHRMLTLPRGGYTKVAPSPRPPFVEPARKPTVASVHQRALQQFLVTPSILVNNVADILHISDGAGRYLHHVAGEVTRNVLSLIIPELRLELRTAVFQTQQTSAPVKTRPVMIGRDARYFQIVMTAYPFSDEVSDMECMLIVFAEDEVDAKDINANPKTQSENQMLSNLERELQRTKVQLQDTIEHSEISSEELKASNEEMQAVNEELRSATEELETSKEELQSINEELLTVNYELKIKVEETDQANDYLRNLISSTDIATVFVDRNCCIKWFTPRATDIFSMLMVDTGRPLMDITHRLDYDDMMSDAMQVFETLNVIEREVQGRNGRWYIARLLPYRSGSDQIDGIVLTFIDITTRRTAEDELRLGEERLRLVAENTRDYAIIVIDEEGRISSWNNGAEQIFGYSKTEAEGKPFAFLFTDEDKVAGVPEQELSVARKLGRSEDERWHLRKDGRKFYCSGEVTLLKGEDFQGFVKIARDLTQHMRLHEEQSQHLAETRQSSQLKDEFFAVMSHELKHPLNLIQLNAHLLRRLPAIKREAAAMKAVASINDAVNSQARIIDDLLDVARIRTGKLKLEASVIDFLALVEEIRGVVEHSEHQRDITFNLPDGGGIYIEADPTRVEQIVWNLINNAIKFTPAGGAVTVKVASAAESAWLEVSDTGPGIEKSQLEHIFQMFGQANHRPSTGHKGGLGIGLSLVKQLVEAHGGSISAHSDGPGKGATFKIAFPLSNPPVASTKSQTVDDVGLLHGVKVLLVDDAADVLETMALLLEMEEAQVVAFADARQALEAAKSTVFDVVISDVGMPVMDGYEFVRLLRQLDGYAQTPCVALTGYGAGQVVTGKDASGFDECVGKPVAYDDFVGVLRRLVMK